MLEVHTSIFRMGTDARSKMNSEVKPGPGYYEVNSKTVCKLINLDLNQVR